jgi:hypothetical protein
MRLLVYGGTGYYERQRIGSWGTISREALEDTYGLPQDKNIYGLGIADNQPALIFRQRQQTETTRSYAYTLLLDPGKSIWQRFGWNAAAFAQALFEDAHETAQQLLKNPEGLYLDALENVLRELTPKESRNVSSTIDDQQALWIGAAFDSSLLDLPLSVFNFTARPDFSVMAKFISSLPHCFRAGFGWIVGGSGQNGRSLGARFALDGATNDDIQTEKLIAAGRQFFASLQILTDNEEFEELSAKPLWEWAENAAENSEQIANRLTMIAELLEGARHRKPSLEKIVDALQETDFLEREMRSLAQQRAFSVGSKLTGKQTDFVLQNHFLHDLPLNGDLNLLDEKTVARKFLEEDLDHTKLQRFPLAVRELVWSNLLARTSSNEDVPSILINAIDDLETDGRNIIQRLIQIVGQRMQNPKFSLHYWRRYRTHRYFHLVEEMLARTAFARAEKQAQGWEEEYLLFAKDDGGKKLFNTDIYEGTLQTLVRKFRTIVRNNEEFASEALDWLSALAGSEIRYKGVLTVTDKISIAESVGGRWACYSALWNAYYNKPDTFELSQAPSDRELWILRNELIELVEKYPARDFVPDVRRLQKLFGALEKEVIEILGNLSPEFSNARDASNWVSALAPNNPEKASRAIVRYLTSSEDAAQSGWLFPKFDERQLENLFETLLFKTHPTRNELYRKRLEELLMITEYDNRLAKTINRVFRAGIKNGTHKSFCERFADAPNALQLLSYYLSNPALSSLMDILAQHNQKTFVQQACDCWQTNRNKKEPLAPFVHALFTYLKSGKGKKTLEAVKRVLEEEVFRGDIVDLRLDEILQNGIYQDRYFAENDENYEEEVEQKGKIEVFMPIEEKSSWFEKAKNFLGIGSAESEAEHKNAETNQPEKFSDEPKPRL